MRVLFLFLFLSHLSSSAFALETTNQEASKAVASSRKLKLSEDKQWLRLLHYKAGFLWGFESIIAAPNFFVSPEGKKNSKAELEAYLEKLFTEAPDLPEKESVLCHFPARYLWAQEKLASENLAWPRRSCPDFDRWYQALKGESASLVFSSYFLNNPSSTFGHTLLRIDKSPNAKEGQRFELLDYGVNFAANATTTNPFLYATKGLFGGFPGTFTTTPYYYKVREYNDAESRDLWEYDLNMKPKAMVYLVSHIWELGPTYSDYWYLTENCSYHMVTLLEAADPELDLSSKLKKYVMPSDTVRVVERTPGLVKRIHYRPSIRSEFFARLAFLNDAEKKWLYDTVKNLQVSDGLASWPQDRRKLALDAAMDDIDFTYPGSVQRPETKEAKFKNALLAARSKIPEVTEPLNLQAPALEYPHAGHDTRRWGLSMGSESNLGANLDFNYRFAYHDLTDPILGYPEYAKITFFDSTFSYFQNYQKLDLTQLSLFEVVSLSPYTRFSKSLSWRLKLGFESFINPSCTGCRAFAISGGPGYTLGLPYHTSIYFGAKALVAYTADSAGIISDATLPRWLLGLGPNLTLRTRFTPQLIALVEGWYRKDVNVSYSEYKEVNLTAQWSPRDYWGIRGGIGTRWFESQSSLGFLYYY